MENFAIIAAFLGLLLIGLGGLFYILGCMLSAIADKRDRTPVWHETGSSVMRIEFIEERADNSKTFIIGNINGTPKRVTVFEDADEYFILNHNEFKQHTEYYEN